MVYDIVWILSHRLVMDPCSYTKKSKRFRHEHNHFLFWIGYAYCNEIVAVLKI